MVGNRVVGGPAAEGEAQGGRAALSRQIRDPVGMLAEMYYAFSVPFCYLTMERGLIYIVVTTVVIHLKTAFY